MENKDEQIIRSAMNSHLSGLQLSRQAHLALKDKIQGGEPVKKRIPIALILVAALLLATVTALAVSTLMERHTREVLELRDGYALLRWDMEDKIAFVEAMERAELPMDQEKLKALRQADTSNEEKERLADSLIDARYGKVLAEYKTELSAEPHDQPKGPIAEVVFREAYFREHPEATAEEAHQAFDAFLMAYLKVEVLTEEEVREMREERAGRRATQEEIIEKMSANLTETGLGLDAWELTKTQITASFDEAHKLWVGSATIRGEDIAEEKRKWLLELKQYGQDTFFKYEDGVFSVSYVMEENGDHVPDAYTLEDYEYLKLVPDTAWGELPDQSLEWKAKFSQTYRDKARAWMDAHPNYISKTNPSTEWITRNPYGLPGSDDIPQEEALRIAKERFIASSPKVTEEGIEKYCKTRFYFRVNTPEKPMWKVIYMLKEGDYTLLGIDFETMKAYDLFITDIDAKTGEVLKTYDDYQDKSADFAEMFM